MQYFGGSNYFKNFRICFVWCCILYCAFSAFEIRESSLSKWDPIFWLRSSCFGWTPPPAGGFVASAAMSLDASTDVSSVTTSSDTISSCLQESGSSGLCCGVPPRELTFPLSNVPRLPQTVCKKFFILY